MVLTAGQGQTWGSNHPRDSMDFMLWFAHPNYILQAQISHTPVFEASNSFYLRINFLNCLEGEVPSIPSFICSLTH